MYTKIFLLVLIFNIVPQKASDGFSSQSMNVENRQTQNNVNTAPQHSKEEKSTSHSSGSDWSDIGQHSQQHQNTDDDGKCHRIHFDRYLHRRNKNMYCLFGKLVLLISYLCSMYCNFIHLLH